MSESGAFSADFAAKRSKRHKIDEQLVAALTAIIPDGAHVLDLGAGAAGPYVEALCAGGDRYCRGIDGSPNSEELSGGLVKTGDLTDTGIIQKLWPGREWSWAISIEVGEHIPQEWLGYFLHVLTHAATDGLIVSWARPGQRGRGHVSCRSPEWVANQLARMDWQLHDPSTVKAREIAGGGWKKKLLVFRKGTDGYEIDPGGPAAAAGGPGGS
jgi:hypothetical protein